MIINTCFSHAAGLSKLLNPLRGSARGLGSGRRAEDWTRQLSERGRGTPRSWAEDSGKSNRRGAAAGVLHHAGARRLG